MLALLKKLRDSRLGRAFAPLYELVVAAELLFERLLDKGFTKQSRAPELQKITAVIKTFERPGKLKKLVASIRRLYPELAIIIVDDSKAPAHLAGVQTFTMPYDSGISAGRNAGLAAVKTEYMLCLDDDFVFNRHTDLLAVLNEFEKHPGLDLIAGEVVYLPLRIRHDYGQVGVFCPHKAPLVAPLTYIGCNRVLLKVPNFYLAKTEKLRLVGWDSELKRMDHADFFTRAAGRLVSAQNKAFQVLHCPSYFDQGYLRVKQNNHNDRALLAKKYPKHVR